MPNASMSRITWTQGRWAIVVLGALTALFLLPGSWGTASGQTVVVPPGQTIVAPPAVPQVQQVAGLPLTIRGQAAQLVSLPPGQVLTILDSVTGRVLLPAGTIVRIGGQDYQLTEPLEAILGLQATVAVPALPPLTTPVVQPPVIIQAPTVLPRTGDAISLLPVLAVAGLGGASVVLGAALKRRWRTGSNRFPE